MGRKPASQPHAKRWRRRASLYILLATLGAFGILAQPGPPELRILQRVPLPQARSVATDIRWAGDDAVYVSWFSDGVALVGLEGSRRRTLVPERKILNTLRNYNQLAVSSRALAVAADAWSFAWRPLQGPVRGQEGRVLFDHQEIAITYDFDILGDKMVLLGLSNLRPSALQGEIAFLGTLSARLEDLRPILLDAGGPGAPAFYRCQSHQVGGIRFLPDGSFVTAPGFQDGIHLFNNSGKQVRSWSNKEAGIDTHIACSQMTEKQEEQLRMRPEVWQRWLNSHRVLDDILPLPQGPGLLVRSRGKDGQARWDLKVLRPDGVATYRVPVVAQNPFERLRGDVRNGRIVLLRSRSGFSFSHDPTDFSAEILIMEIPKS